MTQPTRNLIEPILGSSPLLLLFTILYIIVRFSLKKRGTNLLIDPQESFIEGPIFVRRLQRDKGKNGHTLQQIQRRGFITFSLNWARPLAIDEHRRCSMSVQPCTPTKAAFLPAPFRPHGTCLGECASSPPLLSAQRLGEPVRPRRRRRFTHAGNCSPGQRHVPLRGRWRERRDANASGGSAATWLVVSRRPSP